MAGSAVPSVRRCARSQFRDGYRGWASSKSGEGGDEVPLYESYFWRYGTALLVAMREAPAVYGNPEYRARYDRLLRFAEVHIFEKWYSAGTARLHLPRPDPHGGALGADRAEPVAGSPPIPARRARYLDVVDNIDLHLPGHGTRPARPAAAQPGGAHRVLLERRLGLGTAARAGRQPRQRRHGVRRRGARPRPELDRRRHGGLLGAADEGDLAGRNAPTAATWTAPARDNGWFSDGFVKLGRFDPAVQRRLEDHQVVNDQFAANMAFNARILRS